MSRFFLRSRQMYTYMLKYRPVAWVVHGHHPDDGGSRLLWNVDKLRDFTTQQTIRQSFSYSPQLEAQVLLSVYFSLNNLVLDLVCLQHVKANINLLPWANWECSWNQFEETITFSQLFILNFLYVRFVISYRKWKWRTAGRWADIAARCATAYRVH
jgi:hypothetical protein